MNLAPQGHSKDIESMRQSDTFIEILSPQLIKLNPLIMREVDDLQKRLGLDIGWHYILGLIWILKLIQPSHGMKILDAGAGKGVLQFVMAERGASILSVDFNYRRFPLHLRMGYEISYSGSSHLEHPYLEHLSRRHQDASNRLRLLRSQVLRVLYASVRLTRAGISAPGNWLMRRLGRRNPGGIVLYTCDMVEMNRISSGSVDSVVSLSAIEHMAPEDIKRAYKEFWRIVRPGGRIAITTNASNSEDWYHQPSKAWCFSESSIRELFHLGAQVPSNWSNYPESMGQIRNSRELRSRLSPSYRLSGQNGMPWGEWQPSYLPVGIMIERARE